MRAVPGSPWPWRGWEFQWEVPVGAPGLASHGPSGSWGKGPGGLCNKQRLVIGHQLRAGRKGTLGKATLWHWSYWKAVSLHLREHWRARLSLQRSRSAPILPEMLISSRGIQTSVIGHHAPSGPRLLRAARGRCNTDVPRGRGSLPRRALRGRAEAEAEEVVAPRGARRGSPAHRHPQVSGAALGRFAAAWRWGVAQGCCARQVGSGGACASSSRTSSGSGGAVRAELGRSLGGKALLGRAGLGLLVWAVLCLGPAPEGAAAVCGDGAGGSAGSVCSQGAMAFQEERDLCSREAVCSKRM